MNDANDHRSLRPMAMLVIPLIACGVTAIGLATIVQRRVATKVTLVDAAVIFADTFDRGDTDSQEGLGGLSGSREWTETSGTWAIDLGRAYIVSSPGPAAALIDDVPDGRAISIKATIGGSTSCGIVARYVDDENFVSLTHLPEVGVWALTVVEAGEPRVVQRLLAQRIGDVTIQLTVGPRLISASAGLQSASVAAPAPPGSRDSSVGIFASDVPGTCTWDSVVVTSAG